MIFTWCFWVFHDIPGLGKYDFPCSVQSMPEYWFSLTKIFCISTESKILSLQDNIRVRENSRYGIFQAMCRLVFNPFLDLRGISKFKKSRFRDFQSFSKRCMTKSDCVQQSRQCQRLVKSKNFLFPIDTLYVETWYKITDF